MILVTRQGAKKLCQDHVRTIILQLFVIYFQTASTILFVYLFFDYIFSVPPLLDGKNLHDLVVVAGDRVKFDVPFQGIPTPEVKWIKVCFFP